MPRLPYQIQQEPYCSDSKINKIHNRRGKLQLRRDAKFITKRENVDNYVLENISHDYESMLLPTGFLVNSSISNRGVNKSVLSESCKPKRKTGIKSACLTHFIDVPTLETMSGCSCAKEDCGECAQYEYESMPHFGREESEVAFIPIEQLRSAFNGFPIIVGKYDPITNPQTEIDPLLEQEPDETCSLETQPRQKSINGNSVKAETIWFTPDSVTVKESPTKSRLKTRSSPRISNKKQEIKKPKKKKLTRKRKRPTIEAIEIVDAETFVDSSNVDVGMLPAIQIEEDPIQQVSQNMRKVVDLRYAVQWALGLQFNHSKCCPQGQLVVKSENKDGISPNELILECDSCFYRSNQ